MNYPLISLIVVGFYEDSTFIKCIKSLTTLNYPNYEIILIWSATKRDFKVSNYLSKNRIDQSRIFIQEYSENLGYARGNNIGVNFSKGEFVLIINPDVEVESDFLTLLYYSFVKLKEKKNSDKIIIGPRISNAKGIIEYSRRTVNFLGFSNMDISKSNKIRRTMISSGCAFLIKRNYFYDIGGFEDFYFMYHEDIDFSINAEKKGFKQYVDNSIKLWHIKSDEEYRLTPFKYFYHERNRLIFTFEHSTKKIKMLICQLLMEPFHIVFALMKNGFLKERVRIYKYIFKNKKRIFMLNTKNNQIFDKNYHMDGIFNEVKNSTIISFFNFYARVLFLFYHH